MSNWKSKLEVNFLRVIKVAFVLATLREQRIWGQASLLATLFKSTRRTLHESSTRALSLSTRVHTLSDSWQLLHSTTKLRLDAHHGRNTRRIDIPSTLGPVPHS